MAFVVSCPHFPACSGCRSIGRPHVTQLEEKLAGVRTLFEQASLPGFDPARIEKITANLNEGAYRNRAKLVPARAAEPARVKLGLYRAGSHDVVDIPDCPVQLRDLNQAIEVIRRGIDRCGIDLYDEVAHTGDLRFVSVRQGASTAEVLVGFVTRTSEFAGREPLTHFVMDRCTGVVGVVQNINPRMGNVIFGPETRLLSGRDYLEEQVCGIRIRLGLTSFFQVNTATAEKAYEAIISHLSLSKDMTLLDLYSGVGAVGLIASPHVRRVIAIEEVPEAIDLADSAARANGLDNIESWEGLVETRLTGLLAESPRESMAGEHLAVAVNPPRKGLDPRVVRTLVQLGPGRIAYLSCYPRTLLRDLGRLANGGYRVSHVELFDMFPQTEQVETLAIVERVQRKSGSKRGKRSRRKA
jgi:23S rRNA (uracil1939-C5)-methyltransferase